MEFVKANIGRLRLHPAEWFGVCCLCTAVLFYQVAYVLPFAPILFGILNTLLIVQVIALMFFTRFSFFGLFHLVLTYCLIFFGFMPPLELISGATYWGGSSTVFALYPQATLLCIMGIGSFALTYFALYSGSVPQKAEDYKLSPLTLVSISAAAALIIYAYNGFSIGSVMFRGGDFVQRMILGQTAWLIYQYFLYPVPSICLVAYLLFGKQRPIPTLILFVLFLMANPATGMARFQAASLYISVLLALIPRLWSQRSFMITLLFFGVFLILPILDIFRRFTDNSTLSYDTSFIYAGHFDGFQMFALALQEGQLTWGRQLLGALLFFVPRTLWADKPVSSGSFLAGDSGLVFDNISFPFFAEGYINFGFAGIVLFSFFLGWFCAKYDTRARWNGLSGRSLMFYHFLVGLLFFLMRGSLMNGVAFTLGTYVSILLIYSLARR